MKYAMQHSVYMRTLNTIVWYTGFIVSIVPVCLIFFYLWGTEIWIEIPLAIGLIGALIIIAIDSPGIMGSSGSTGSKPLGLRPPEPTSFPVPFIGLSSLVGSQMFALAKNGGLMFVLPFTLLGNIVLAVIVALITIPIGAVMLLMAACLIPYIAVVDGIYLLAVFVAKVVDRYHYDTNTGKLVCPSCGKASARPDYLIEGSTFHGLSPSEKGVLSVEMYTMSYPCYGSKGGRKDLPQRCPECNDSLSTREGKPFVVSMVGAPGSGKTSFIFSVAGTAKSSMGNGNASKVEFYRPSDESLLLDYRSGRCGATPVQYVPSRILTFESSHLATPRHLYMCDVSGRFFSSDVVTDLQPQYSYNDAIVFMVDPTRPNPESVAYSAYVGFMEKYRLFNKMDASGRIPVPFALVLSRSDVPGPFSGLSGEDLKEKMAEEGYFTLINAISKDFLYVSYHACNASKEDGSASAVMSSVCSKAGSSFLQFF